MKIRASLLIAVYLLMPVWVFGLDTEDVPEKPTIMTLDAGILEGRSLTLGGWIKYHEGDVEGAHLPDYDDSDWDYWNRMWFNPNDLPNEWNGIRWYRHHIRVDSTMYDTKVALYAMVFGATEVWLNGELVFQDGVLSSDEDTFEYAKVRTWIPVTLSSDSLQVVAVKHVNPRIKQFKKSSFYLGMNLTFQDLKRSRDLAVSNNRFVSGMQWFIVGFCFVFAIIHLLFYLFNRRLIFNLWFSITCFVYLFGSWVQNQFYFYTDIEQMMMLQRFMQSAMILSFAFMCLFLYSVLNLKKPLYFKIIFGIALFLSVIHALNLIFHQLILLSGALLGIQIVYISIKAIYTKIDGAWLLGSGALIFILSIFLVLGLELTGNYMTDIGFSVFHSPYIGFGIALIAMSVYQSRHLAKLNLDLTRHLREVKLLSDKNLEHERSIREAEVQRVRLETENERKTAELDKARELQLSLLPATLPKSDAYTMHAAMFTATEVGGDYYDVITKPDGTMIWAIGDATGHGTEAGFLAAMTKTLFQTLAPNLNADDCLRSMSATLKDAGLRKKFMCLGLMHIKKENISWCSAGIPSALLLRAESGTVEFMESKGMPLATVLKFNYQVVSSTMNTGDVLLLMSDGLMEQMNAEREQFGMDRVVDCLLKAKNKEPESLITELMTCLNSWRNDQPQQDDVSIVCLMKQ